MPDRPAGSSRQPLRHIAGCELLEELGRGGMGTVWRARDPRLAREVALKLLHAGRDASPFQRERFLREARALARLAHPGIVRVHAAGEDDGRPWVSMELLPGGSLSQRVKANGPLPEREAAALGAKLARALDHAHAAGVLHRDVKPQNVLLDAQGAPVLVDFGLALLHGPADARLTATGVFVGTPGYWAPEQALGRSGQIGPASDVWGLGATLYALLTGRGPRRGTTPGEQLAEAEAPVPPPRERRPGLDLRLQEIVLRCLEQEPGARWSSAGELAGALEAWLEPPTRRRLPLALAAPLVPLAPLLGLLLAWAGAAREATALRARLAAEREGLARATARPASTARPGPTPETPAARRASALPPVPPGSTPEVSPAQVPAAAREWKAQAVAAERRKDLAAEIAAYTAAIELAPGWFEPRVGRAMALAAAGDHASALVDWDQMLAAWPEATQLYQFRAEVRRALGDEAGARADAERGAAAVPNEAVRLLQRAMEARMAGDPERAEGEVRAALAADGQLGPAWLFLAQLLGNRGAVDEALAAVDRAAGLMPGDVDVLFFRADLLGRRDPAAARAELLRLERLAPGHPELRRQRATLEGR